MIAAHPRVLLAENGFTETGVTIRSLCAERAQSLEVFSVSKQSNLRLALQTYCPDVALLDLALFHPDSARAIHVLHQAAPYVRLILFSGPSDRECAAHCLQVGATDFVLEGSMDARTLERVLQGVFREVDEESAPEAWRDPQSGLMNRAGLVMKSQRWREAHSASARRLLVSIRVHNFEAIQWSTNEEQAKLFLQKIAMLLRTKVRSTDLAAHVAPGHFVLLVQDVTEASLPAVHRRIANRLRDFHQDERLGIFPQFSLHSEFLPAGSSPPFTEMLLLDAAKDCVLSCGK